MFSLVRGQDGTTSTAAQHLPCSSHADVCSAQWSPNFRVFMVEEPEYEESGFCARLLEAGVGQQALPAAELAPQRVLALVGVAPALLGQAPEHRRRDVHEVVEAQEAARRQHLRHMRQRACEPSGVSATSAAFLKRMQALLPCACIDLEAARPSQCYHTFINKCSCRKSAMGERSVLRLILRR